MHPFADRPGRSARVALAAAALLLALPAGSHAAVTSAHAHERSGLSITDAPGLLSGPFISAAGLIWEGPQGVMATAPSGRSRRIAGTVAPNRGGTEALAWLGRGWWVLARRRGVFGGPLGGRLVELPQLHSCNPGSPEAGEGSGESSYAISGGTLFAAIAPRCLGRRGAGSEILAIDLRSRRARALTKVAGTVTAIAAAGRYLALAYEPASRVPESDVPTHFRLLDSRTGATIKRLKAPVSLEHGFRARLASIQVDGEGDLLASYGDGMAPPWQEAHAAQPPRPRPAWWWAPLHSTRPRPLDLGAGEAVLSQGRVAFLGRGERAIEVRNLGGGHVRVLVTFTGSLSPQGLAFSGGRLAWAQQSSVVDVKGGPVNGGYEYSCRTVPLSPVELGTLDVGATGTHPLLLSGAPIPAQYAHEPPCVEV